MTSTEQHKTANAYAQLERLYARHTRLLLDADRLYAQKMALTTTTPDYAAKGEDFADKLTNTRLAAHDLLTRPDHRIGSLLATAEAQAAQLNEWQRANLSVMRRLYNNASALPPYALAQVEHASAQGEVLWQEHVASHNFKALQPALEKIVAARRQLAQAQVAALSGDALTPYDACLEEWSPGLRYVALAPILSDLEARLPHILAEAQRLKQSISLTPQPAYSRKQWLAVARIILQHFGLGQNELEQDGVKCQLTTNANPYCWGEPRDFILAIEHTGDIVVDLNNLLHEMGHARYLTHLTRLPEHWQTQPIGQLAGYAVHESQAMVYEQLTLHPAFFDFVAPLLQAELGTNASAAQLWAHFNTTRTQHSVWGETPLSLAVGMLVRIKTERALMNGALSVQDLPQFFCQQLEKLTGEPQDPQRWFPPESHWLTNNWGYFPAYLLGAISASQQLHSHQQNHEDFEQSLAQGQFGSLNTWLFINVHSHGARHETLPALRKATSDALDVRFYLERLLQPFHLAQNSASATPKASLG